MSNPCIFAGRQFVNNLAQETHPIVLILLVLTREVEIFVVAA
jgi:hypothetical protein